MYIKNIKLDLQYFTTLFLGVVIAVVLLNSCARSSAKGHCIFFL